MSLPTVTLWSDLLSLSFQQILFIFKKEKKDFSLALKLSSLQKLYLQFGHL